MPDINLFPWREQLQLQEQRYQAMEVILSVVFSGLLLLLLHAVLNSQLAGTKATLLQLQGRLENVRKKWEDVRVIYQALEYQKIPAMDLRTILYHQQRILDFLQKMAQSIPDAVLLRQIRFEKNTWHIEGLSAEISEILHYSERLGAAFKQANAMDIKQKEGLFYFQLRIENVA